MFIGYNGGHVLPSVYPQGVEVTSDPCSKQLAGSDFQALSIRFFDEVLKGRSTGLRGWGKLHIATPTSTCTTVSSPAPDTTIGVGTITTPAAAGPPLAIQVAQGPIRIAGSSYLTGKVTTLTPDSRAFLGLAIGTSPADAKLVQKNVMPMNEPAAVTGQARRIELPAVAVDVPKGQNLYLLVSAEDDSFAGMQSRVPGVITIDGAKVHLPVVG
jgi:hypothetical protein